MLNRVVLFILLLGTWLIFSGFFTPFFIVVGVLSCLISTVLFVKISKSTDEKCNLLILMVRFPLYIVWLIKEITSSSLSVSKKMWQLEPEISPEIDWIPTPLKDDIGLTIFANSITLTPGTVTTNVRADGMVQVHALTKEGIQQIRDGVGYSKVAKIIKKKEQVK